MYTIENEQLKVDIKTKGAELDSIFSKKNKLEYMWGADPAFWPKKSPILFPIVGTVKQNTYYYDNVPFQLNRHGFARDMEFSVTTQNGTSITMTLAADPTTLKVYPFPFTLSVTYTVDANELAVTYHVTNRGTGNMFFSIGGHPAFRMPLESGLHYEDYYIEFEEKEQANRWLISPEGLIESESAPYLKGQNKVQLSKAMFSKDAVVFKGLKSSRLTIKTDRSSHGFMFEFKEFPYMAFWATPNADFICIEPWCGIADSTGSSQQLVEKDGINQLLPNQEFVRSWKVRCF